MRFVVHDGDVEEADVAAMWGLLWRRDSELGCTQAFRQLDTGDNLTESGG